MRCQLPQPDFVVVMQVLFAVMDRARELAFELSCGILVPSKFELDIQVRPEGLTSDDIRMILPSTKFPAVSVRPVGIVIIRRH
jgi:hypothetical protein